MIDDDTSQQCNYKLVLRIQKHTETQFSELAHNTGLPLHTDTSKGEEKEEEKKSKGA